MTNPTTGGVTASFASVCDLTLAEPGALIGFAGPRVISSTIKQELPRGLPARRVPAREGPDRPIVSREALRETLARLISYGTHAWPGYGPIPSGAPEEEADAGEQGTDAGSDATNGRGGENGNGHGRDVLAPQPPPGRQAWPRFDSSSPSAARREDEEG